MRQTTEAGFYVLSPLPAGDYTVKVTANGFQSLVQEHILVDALATVGLNLTLKLGSASERVTVEASATMLHTDDATLGSTMQNNVYQALPLAMNGVPRDPTQFVALAPGVSGVSTVAAGPTYASFSGSQLGSNEVYIEGIPLTFAGQGSDTRNLALGVSVDAVEQFQVETTAQKAMYQGQGIENYVLKSGTNQFHGTLFEYFRNTHLDARGFFPASTPVEHQNEFGGTVGGPIKKDKIFFFGSYDGYYYNTAETPIYQAIPTLAERNGDFGQLPATIYDPTTQACSGAICSKQPFAGNIVPSSRISPISRSFQSYLPNPTNPGIQNNYLASLPETVRNKNTTDKVDINLTETHRIVGVFSQGKYATNFTGSLTPSYPSLPLPYTGGRFVQETATTAQIHDTYVLTPSLLNVLSFGYGRFTTPIESATAGGRYPEKAGLTGLPPGAASDVFPTINFTGSNSPIGWAGVGAVAFADVQNTFTLHDSLQWVHGKHALTFGFQLQRRQDNYANPLTGTRAVFNFTNSETAGFSASGTLLSNTGNSYASYLLGGLSSTTITQNYVAEIGNRFHDYSGYIHDDWKLSPKLVLNIGVRYDVFGPYNEVHGVTSYLNPNTPNPAVGGRFGALEFAGYGPGRCNCGNIPIRTDYLNLQPRIGLAYRLNDKTVIRAGYGIYSSHGGGTGNNGVGQSPGQLGFNANQTFSSAVTGQPVFYWESGVPPYQQPPFINAGYGAGFTTSNPTGGNAVNYVNPNVAGKPPYTIKSSLGIQREITANMTVGAAYVGSRGREVIGANLLGAGGVGIWNNSMNPQYLGLGPLLGAQATTQNLASSQAIFPAIGLPFGNYQGTIAQMLKPFPQYSGITYYWSNRGVSSYNALQVNLDRRLSRGFAFRLNYTFSKELDNLATSRNPYDGLLDYGPGTIDRPHVFTGTVVYNLPFGSGHQTGNGNSTVRKLVSNWLISGLVTFSSGAPLVITGAGCTVPGIAGTCIVSYNRTFSGAVRINGAYGSADVSVPYLNSSAFVQPAPYTFGNLPASAPFGVRAPYLLDEDLGIRREIVREKLRFVVQADVFNLTNSVNFAAPGANISSANFGQVISQANLPRKVQLVARFTF